MKLGKDGILYSRTKPRFQNDMDGLNPDNWPDVWKSGIENNCSEFEKLQIKIRHLTDLARSDSTVGELKTTLVCTLNVVSDLIFHLQGRNDGRKPENSP